MRDAPAVGLPPLLGSAVALQKLVIRVVGLIVLIAHDASIRQTAAFLKNNGLTDNTDRINNDTYTVLSCNHIIIL